MTYEDVGPERGHTEESFKGDPLRTLWLRLRDERVPREVIPLPAAVRNEIAALFRDEIIEDTDLLLALIKYFGRNTEAALWSTAEAERKRKERADKTAEDSRKSPEEKKRDEDAAKEEVKRAAAEILWKNFAIPVGPNGELKLVRFCTGTELVEAGTRLGESYKRIGELCGSRIVGEVINEQQMYELLGYK